MALAAVSRSSNIRLRGAEVWLTNRPVAASILSIAPQSGQAISNIFSFALAISILNCMRFADLFTGSCPGGARLPPRDRLRSPLSPGADWRLRALTESTHEGRTLLPPAPAFPRSGRSGAGERRYRRLRPRSEERRVGNERR